MAKPTSNNPAYPSWLQEWKTRHAKPGEQIEPGSGGAKTMRSVYNIAIEAWSPDALVLENIWQGIGN